MRPTLTVQKAVEDGHLDPAVMEEFMANVKPGETKSKIMTKVRKSIGKRYVTPGVMEEVLASVNETDDNMKIIHKIRKGEKTVKVEEILRWVGSSGEAVDNGQLPQSVLDDILANVSPSDDREKVIAKVRQAIEKKQVPREVMVNIMLPSDDKAPIINKIRVAIEQKKLTPSVIDDIALHVSPDERTEVMKKVREAVEKGRLSPSAVEMIRDIDEAKKSKDMDNVLDDLYRSKDKAEIMKHLRTAVDNGKIPQSVMDDVVKNVKPSDKKEETIKKVHKAIKKRQLLPKIIKLMKKKEGQANEAIVSLSPSDLKMINEAGKAGEISPSVMKILKDVNCDICCNTEKESPLNMLLNRIQNKINIIVRKKDIVAHMTGADTDGQVLQRVRQAIKKGEITPSVVKMLLDKDNAGIIFSEEVLRELCHEKCKLSKTKLMTSKSLKTTAASECSSLKTCKSERSTDASCKNRKRNPFCPQLSCDSKHNFTCVGDGMRKYSIMSIGNILTWPKPCQAAKIQPCKCGSEICRKHLEKNRPSQTKLTASEAKLIACVCGSDICEKERNKILEALLKAKQAKAMTAASEKYKKENEKKMKLNTNKQVKARLKRNKFQEKCKKVRQKIKKKLDKRALKEVDNNQASDGALAAESVLDLGRIGWNACSKSYRILTHKQTQCFYHDEEQMYESAARIKHRIRFIAQKYFKKKRVRRVRPPKIECDTVYQTYVHTRNKKPFLWVFHKYPQFYPRCISLFTFWKQFFHMILFILAIIVWSPCLLCTELCTQALCCRF